MFELILYWCFLAYISEIEILLATATTDIIIASDIRLVNMEKSGTAGSDNPLWIGPTIARSKFSFNLAKYENTIPKTRTNISTGIGIPLRLFLNLTFKYNFVKTMSVTATQDMTNANQFALVMFSRRVKYLYK